MNKPVFPCNSFPEDPGDARLLGLYGQRQEGLFMQRLKTPGGRLTLDQWKAAAELALRFTPGVPLHLTTRQDLEFHGLKPADVPALQDGLSKVGLTTVGACGDTLRNITLCPGCDLVCGGFNLEPLAAFVQKHLEALSGIYSMPRKFKISMSCEKGGCARPWINDLGLVVNEAGAFHAILAGSLGARPGTGILCYENIPAAHVLPLTLAAIRLFEEEGDRKHRSRARLRHVRERIGDDAFRRELDKRFQLELSATHAVAPALPQCGEKEFVCTRINVTHGNLDAREVIQLVEVLEGVDGIIRMGLNHDLLLFTRETPELSSGLLTQVDAPTVLACPGAATCKGGLVETQEIAAAVREVLNAGYDLMTAVSGCPNNCAHAAIADIGLIGRIKKIDGIPRPHYKLLAGGGKGRNPDLAIELHPALPVGRVVKAVNYIVSKWLSETNGASGSFGAFINQNKELLVKELA